MSALAALAPRLVAIAALAIVFFGYTLAIGAGSFDGLDLQIAHAMHDVWRESLHPLLQGIAELGGIELTTVLMIGLAIYLWRDRFGADAFVVVAFAGAVALEVLYKYLLYHPGPSRLLSHPDGPSVTQFLGGAGAGNSFPSGHMVRAIVAYGLLAFVIRRLSTSRLVRAAVVPIAAILIAVLALDRLYLDVHWESDVIGGLLLGGIALLAGTVWLDRPRKAEN
jgi:undecaprenyl-diphosphatase